MGCPIIAVMSQPSCAACASVRQSVRLASSILKSLWPRPTASRHGRLGGGAIGGHRGGPARQRGLRLDRPPRLVRHAAERHPGRRDRALLRRDDGRDGDQRELVGGPVAHLAVELPARRRRRAGPRP